MSGCRRTCTSHPTEPVAVEAEAWVNRVAVGEGRVNQGIRPLLRYYVDLCLLSRRDPVHVVRYSNGLDPWPLLRGVSSWDMLYDLGVLDRVCRLQGSRHLDEHSLLLHIPKSNGFRCVHGKYGGEVARWSELQFLRHSPSPSGECARYRSRGIKRRSRSVSREYWASAASDSWQPRIRSG